MWNFKLFFECLKLPSLRIWMPKSTKLSELKLEDLKIIKTKTKTKPQTTRRHHKITLLINVDLSLLSRFFCSIRSVDSLFTDVYRQTVFLKFFRWKLFSIADSFEIVSISIWRNIWHLFENVKNAKKTLEEYCSSDWNRLIDMRTGLFFAWTTVCTSSHTSSHLTRILMWGV